MKLAILRHLKQTCKILVVIQQNPTGHPVEFEGVQQKFYRTSSRPDDLDHSLWDWVKSTQTFILKFYLLGNNFWISFASNPPKTRSFIFLLFKLFPTITKFCYVPNSQQINKLQSFRVYLEKSGLLSSGAAHSISISLAGIL